MAMVKPFNSPEKKTPAGGNLLGDILACQSSTLKPERRPEKPQRQEVYSKPSSSEDSPVKPISTSVSRMQHLKKTNDRSKIKSSNKPSTPAESHSKTSNQTQERRKESSGADQSAPKGGARNSQFSEGFKTPPPPKQKGNSAAGVSKVNELQEGYHDKVRRMSVIATKVKPHLEPSYKKSDITKEDYKSIMRKCVEKIYSESRHTVVRDEAIKKLTLKYIEHYMKHKIN